MSVVFVLAKKESKDIQVPNEKNKGKSMVGFKKEGVLISSVKFQGRSYAMLEDSSSQENLKEDEDLFEQVENKREDSVIENPSLMNNIVKE